MKVWDAVIAVVKRCHERIHDLGAPRISARLELATRTDRMQSLRDKIDSVESKLDS